MPMRALAVAVAALTTCLVAVSTAGAAAPSLRGASFQLPSRNIACGLHGGVLRCDVLSGLRPEPKGRCPGDWTGASLTARGRGGPVCAGDTVYRRSAPVLRYGRSWSRGGLRCASRRTGLTCRNAAGHGFVLARERWRVF